jgi:DNA repair exonuclease SbcCD ATPase subunit
MDYISKEIKKMKAALEMEAPTAEIEALQRDIELQGTKLQEIQEDLSVANVAAGMLKDGGIKARIVRQYVPILNKLINQYLEELDLFCDFQFDENFNETLLSRNRDNFSYGSFSEGQKARINLAILFAWLEVIQARKSTSFNLLVLDEILDGALDYDSLEACVKIFVRESSKRTIMVISPKPANWRNSFEKTLKFKLDKNFSRLEVSC